MCKLLLTVSHFEKRKTNTWIDQFVNGSRKPDKSRKRKITGKKQDVKVIPNNCKCLTKLSETTN